jgi:enoyl-CoA hydratase
MAYEGPDSVDYSGYKALKLQLTEGIMTVTLSNPSKRNAVNPGMNRELTTIWQDLWTDPQVRVIILTGDGRDFCAGVDLVALDKKFNSAQQGGPLNTTTRVAKQHIMNIIECEKPTLAKVRGVAYGMGVNLALACDMVFASEGARFCDSHVKVGMVSGDGSTMWPLYCGMHRAKEYP